MQPLALPIPPCVSSQFLSIGLAAKSLILFENPRIRSPEPAAFTEAMLMPQVSNYCVTLPVVAFDLSNVEPAKSNKKGFA